MKTSDSGLETQPGLAAHRRLTDSARAMQAIFDHSPMGIVRFSPQLKVIHANERFREMLGLALRDLVGLPAGDLIGADNREVLMRLQETDFDNADWMSTGVRELRRLDGTSIWVHWTASVLPADRDRSAEILIMLDDVSAQHEAEQTTLANLTELERLNDLKSEFVGIVSHEFRTALTGIQGFSELIRDDEMTMEEVRELADDINRDALRLNRMITDMLDLDRIEAGKLVLNQGPVNLNDIIADCVDRTRTTSEDHEIKVDLDPDLPVLQADADRLVQVVSNLLSNAIKYSPNGGVIEIRSWAAANQVVVEVADHGDGIPPEFVGRVFERFERYSASPTSRVIGTGLGLPISRQIVELHGGRMWVESRLGIGSIFHFSLPIAS
jgi:PAS domain S-box-containing protein